MATVLIIDDDDLFRASLRAMLETAGHKAVEAPNGRIGVRLAQEAPVDLVMCDIIMDGKDGVTTIGEIHEKRPEVPIIAMSSAEPGDPLADLEIAWVYGAAKSFQKPIKRDVLLAAIDELLAARPTAGA